MSTSASGAKGVDQSFRKKWNKAEYEALALARAAAGGVLPEERATKPIIYDSDRGTSEARQKSLALDVMVGTHVAVEDIKKTGFYCAKCDRSEKDSASWIDHLNSVGHQVRWPFGVRVARARARALARMHVQGGRRAWYRIGD